jgi:hypothetical protein
LKSTLYELLKRIDEGQFDGEVDPVDLAYEKIDDYYAVMEMLELDAERLKKRAEEFKTQAKVQENKREAIKKRLLFLMNHFGHKKMPGNDFTARIVEQKRLKILEKPRELDYLENPKFCKANAKWSGEPPLELMADPSFAKYITAEFSWDTDTIRKEKAEIDGKFGFETQQVFKWELTKK